MAVVSRAAGDGAHAASTAELDLDALQARIARHRGPARALDTCRPAREPGRAHAARAPAGSTGPHEVVVDTADGADRARGRRHPAVHRQPAPHPRLGRRSTASGCSPPAHAYPPPEMPEHLVVIGSGVTGVEFVHMFSSLGLRGHADRVSRQQVLPQKDPEVAAALEDELPRAGACACSRAPGPRASTSTGDGVVGALRRRPRGRRAATRCWPSARSPTPRASASTPPASRSTTAATCRSTTTAVTNVPHIYAAGDLSGKLPLSSVASMQGRKIAEHVMGLHSRGPPPPRLRQGGARPSSPSPRSPTSAWPRPTRSPRAARSGSPRCRSRHRPRR